MADVKTPEARSRNMAAIRSRDTPPELVLRKKLWSMGFRYRKNLSTLTGKPDIVLTKYRICIFVDSEFFHGKGFYSGYESRKYPSLREQLLHSDRPDFWLKKIKGNMERDAKTDAELAGLGWKVLRFWSRDVLKKTEQCLKIIEESVEESKSDTARQKVD